MTTLWKLEAVHDAFEGSFCRLFRSEEEACSAAVPLTMHGWWLDVEQVVWPPLDPMTIDRAVTSIWPIADGDELLDLIAGPPLLERDLAHRIKQFEAGLAASCKPRAKAKADLARIVQRKNAKSHGGNHAGATR